MIAASAAARSGIVLQSRRFALRLGRVASRGGPSPRINRRRRGNDRSVGRRRASSRRTKEESMVALQAVSQGPQTQVSTDFDVIIIGAGVAGLYQLYSLRELGFR